MKDQIEKLKTELREFLELSKTITHGKWKEGHSIIGDGISTTVCSAPLPIETLGKNWSNNRAFIARSRNISPPLVECLLSQIEWLEQYAIPVDSANQQLQQIITIWEESK
jgi:hypothetical protein